MKILHLYLAKRFVKPLLFGLGLFAVLIFLGDLFDKLPKLVRSPATLWVILQYLWLQVPYWTVRVIPMATLLATLFAVSGFVQSGEWVAVQAAGFEDRILFRPVLAMALGVTVLSFAAQETVLPVSYRRAQQLWREKIHPEWEWTKFLWPVLVGRPGQFITAEEFHVKEDRMVRPVMDYHIDGRIVRQIAAQAATWNAGSRRWMFHSGTDREFAPGGETRERPFDTMTTDLDVPPKRLAPTQKEPDEMSLVETWRYLRQVRHLGGSPREALTIFHAKTAFPFTNLILCGLGIPIALRLRRASRPVAFALALAVSFAYLWVIEAGRSLGVAGRVPPIVAAWAPNVLFGILAFWFYRRETSASA